MANRSERAKLVSGDLLPKGGKAHRRLPEDHPIHLIDQLDKDSPVWGYVARQLSQLHVLGLTHAITQQVMTKIIARAERWVERDAEQLSQMLDRERLIAGAHGPIVYYMRIGNRVKIGTSANLRQRLETFNPEELMATEPGGHELERARHAQFHHLRTRGEWFRHEAELAQHIEELRR